jgi:hypothetical protein
MPWYARTLAGWGEALASSGWAISGIEEPRHAETGRPLSLLLHARPVQAS